MPVLPPEHSPNTDFPATGVPCLSLCSQSGLPFDFSAPDSTVNTEADAQSYWFTEAKAPVPPAADFMQDDPAKHSTAWPVPATDSRQHYLEVFCRDEIEAVADMYPKYVVDRERRVAIEKIIDHLRQSGAYRALPRIPVGWRHRLDHLETQFPNFREYLTYLRTTYALAEREGRGTPQWEPVLLNGEPGIGKSLVIQTVAECLMGVRSHTLRMESQQTNAEIIGTAEHWANAQPGKLARELIFGNSASPLVVLEEVDKVITNEYSPLSALYELMERDSAASFHDQAYPWLKINCSGVIFVCASNTIASVPAPILSRMKVIEISAPTPEQSLTIVAAIWYRLCEDWPAATKSLALADDALHAAALHPPRVIRKGLHEAIGRVVYDGRDVITADDIVACMGHREKPRRCGFV